MISVFLDGRLGNQLFQYAITRIVAEKNNYNFYIPNNKNIDINTHINDNPHLWLGNGLFNCDLGKKDSNIKHIYHNITHTYRDDVFNISDNVELRGYFQTEKYFKGFENKIREWFKPIECCIAQEKIEIYKDCCFIHFRGNDYKNIDKFYLPENYYKEAKIKSGFENFVVVTDDVVEAKKIFPDDIIESNNIKTDFNLLYNAKNIIISNSSFSWWAAWLNENNNVIAPNGWFNYNNWYDSEQSFQPPDIYTEKFNYI